MKLTSRQQLAPERAVGGERARKRVGSVLSVGKAPAHVQRNAFASVLRLQPSRKRGRALEAVAGMCPRGAANTVPNSSHHRVCAARLVLSAALQSQLQTYPAELIPTSRSPELPFHRPRAPASVPSAPPTPPWRKRHPPQPSPYLRASV